jgi:hypothetical protein
MVIIKNIIHNTSNNQQYVQGRGYVEGGGLNDYIKSIGNFLSENKDLMIKPALSGISNLAVTGLTEGSKLLLTKILNNKKSKEISTESKKLLNDIVEGNVQVVNPEVRQSNPVTNIIGNGVKRF